MLRLSNFTISCEFLQKLSRKAKEIGGSPSYTWSSKDELLTRKISRYIILCQRKKYVNIYGRNVRTNWWRIEKTLLSVFVPCWKLLKMFSFSVFVQDLKYWSIKNKKINVKILLSTFRTSTTQRHKIKTKVRTSFDFETSYDRNNKSRSFYNSSTEKMNDGTRRMSELENSNCDKNENGKCDNILVESSDEIIAANESGAVLTGEVQKI